MNVKLFLSAMFAGAALMAADPAENLVLKQDFEKGADQFVKAPEKVKITAKVMPSLVDGRVAGTKAVKFDEKAIGYTVNGAKLPVPGNISIWIKSDDKVKGAGAYRRFIGTTYHPAGYLGFQEYTNYSLLFVHNFNKKNKNVFVKAMPVGQWNHVSMNFTDKHVDVYLNGAKVTSSDLPESISKIAGNICLGAKGFAMDSYEVYNRVLTDDEIKALAK